MYIWFWGSCAKPAFSFYLCSPILSDFCFVFHCLLWEYAIFLVFQGGKAMQGAYDLTIWLDWKLCKSHTGPSTQSHITTGTLQPHNPTHNPKAFFILWAVCHPFPQIPLYLILPPPMWTGVGVVAGLYVWVQPLASSFCNLSAQRTFAKSYIGNLNKVKGANSRTLQADLILLLFSKDIYFKDYFWSAVLER